MNPKMIPCTLAPGFFDSEFYVFVGSSSAIVDKSILKIVEAPRADVEGRGLLQVFVIETKNDQALVELPGEMVVGGPRAWVSTSLLEERAAA